MEFLIIPLVLIGLAGCLTLEHIRSRVLPETKPFAWGYFLGVCGVCLGALAVAALVSAPFTSRDHVEAHKTVFGSLIAIFAWGVPGLFVIKRRAWAWAVLTICSLNPIVWVANLRYGHNRWEEFRREGGACRLKDAVAAGGCIGMLCLLIAWAGVEGTLEQRGKAARMREVSGTEMAQPSDQDNTERHQGPVFTIPPEARIHCITGKVLPYSLTLTGDWKEFEQKRDFDTFFHLRDVAFIGVIAEEAELETPLVVQAAQQRLRQVSSVEPIFANTRTTQIDGRDWQTFRASAVIDGLKLTYVFFVYGGREGTFQVIGSTTSNLIAKYGDQLETAAQSFTFPKSAASAKL